MLRSQRYSCRCIYEFMECKNDMNCIGCDIAQKFWAEFKNIEKDMEILVEHLETAK